MRVLSRITLLCAALALTACASRNPLLEEAPGTETVQADAAKSAAVANSGAKTVTLNKLQKFLWIFSPYRPDIQQGNFVSQEMLNQLKVGQTKDQVKFLLGTPLLQDVFHAERWDYPFRMELGSGELTTSRVTVYFKDGKVERFDGGNLPTEQEYIARIAGPAAKKEKEPPKKEEVGALQVQVKQ